MVVQSCYAWPIMVEDNVVRFPETFDTEIALAERAYDLILERMAHGRLSEDVPAGGDVATILDTIGELLRLDAMEADGRRVSQKAMRASVAGLESAVDRLGEWPEIPRLLAMTPLIEALEELEIEWLATELIVLLPEISPETIAKNADVSEALGRIALVHVRLLMANHFWDSNFEGLVHLVRARALRQPDDEELGQTLKQAVVYHAILGRQALLEGKRRRMAAAEPLPDDLVAALDEFGAEVFPSELIRWSLHLVLADALATGLVPKWAKPKQVIAAAEIAMVRADEPDLDLDVLKLSKWARTKPKTLRTLSEALAEALERTPTGFEDSSEYRQGERWRIESGPMDFWPPRWTPNDDAKGLPAYSSTAARARLKELNGVAWMMIDSLEAVRFVAGAFRYGGDAPDEMDADLGLEAIRLWKAERLIDADDAVSRRDEPDWDDDLDDDTTTR
jgi:hypothetical protein